MAENAHPRIGRRALLSGTLGALGVLQWQSLRGSFDHRSCEPSAAGDVLRALPPLAGSAAELIHIGHSTHLIRSGGLRVLTDPWFFDPAHGGMWHAQGPLVDPAAIGALDIVLITHEHPDHADPKALDRLDKRALVVVATRELATLAKRSGFQLVEYLAPWRAVTHRGIEISAVPAVHDVYEVSYVLRAGPHRIYFAGDTALHRDMHAIAERFAPTLSILPVDGTRLRGDARLVMDPADALRAARILRSALVVTSHADARFVDAVLSWYATQEQQAAVRFRRLLAAQLPEVHCPELPIGGRIQLPQV